MKLLNWTVEGFGRIQDSITYTPTDGLTLWQAPNGTGKTTLISALIWCLFGKPLKDIPTAQIPTYLEERLPSFKGTRVIAELLLNDGRLLRVARHIKYKESTYIGGSAYPGGDALYIEVGSDLIADIGDKLAQDAYLKSLLGIDRKMLLNSSVFGQRMQRLVEAKPAEQRELFETLFNLDWVNEFGEKAKANLADFQGFHSKLNEESTLANKLVADSEQRLVILKEGYEEDVTAFETTKAVHQANIAEGQAQVLESSGYLATLKNTKALTDYQQVLNQINENNISADSLLKEITRNKAHLTGLEADRDATSGTISRMEVSLSTNGVTEDNKASLLITGVDLKADCTKATADLTVVESELSELHKSLAENKSDLRVVLMKGADVCAAIRGYHAEKTERGSCTSCGAPLSDEAHLAHMTKRGEALAALEAEKLALAIKETELTTEITEISNVSIPEYTMYVADATEAHRIVRAAYMDQTSLEEDNQKLLLTYTRLVSGIADYKAILATHISAISTVTEVLAGLALEAQELDEVYTQLESQAIAGKDTYLGLTASVEATTNDIQVLERTLAVNRSLLNALQPPSDRAIKAEDIRLQAQVSTLEGLTQALQNSRIDLVAAKLLVEAASAKGLKARLVSVLLANFNDAINISAHDLGVHVEFSVDESKASMPFEVKVDILQETVWRNRSYHSLSGGEQQRVSLAVTLGMIELLNSFNPLDFALLDEVFEGLDSEGLSVCYDLLAKGVLRNKKVIVISHSDAPTMYLNTQRLQTIKGHLTIT